MATNYDYWGIPGMYCDSSFVPRPSNTVIIMTFDSMKIGSKVMRKIDLPGSSHCDGIAVTPSDQKSIEPCTIFFRTCVSAMYSLIIHKV